MAQGSGKLADLRHRRARGGRGVAERGRARSSSPAADRPASRSTSTTASPSCSRASTTASRSSTRTREGRSRHVDVQPGAGERDGRPAVPLQRDVTSALGDQACASCHIGGDFDGLAWDLGNPGTIPLADHEPRGAASRDIRTIPEALHRRRSSAPQSAGLHLRRLPARKGPMTTQSLRGLDNHGAMHWRGDRNGAVQQTGAPFLDGSGNPVVSAQPNSGIFDEFNAFKSFNVAFPGLVGNARAAERRRHDRLRELHPPGRRTRRTRSAPRRLADGVAAGRQRVLPQQRARRPELPSTGSTTATAATRSTATATPATQHPASSGPTVACRSRTSRRPSRCRTSATRTRRSACSRRRSTRCTRSARHPAAQPAAARACAASASSTTGPTASSRTSSRRSSSSRRRCR